jgi:hypothetical protein
MTFVMIISLIVAVSIVAFLFWTQPKSKQVLDRIVVETWYEGFDAVDNIQRRQFEERKRVEDDEHRRAASDITYMNAVK